jgi:RNA polymerase sigma factor (sigma-70 family)
VTKPRTTCTSAREQFAGVPRARHDDVDALVHRAARGEERAWALLVGRFDATVRSLARRYGLNDADRDEVAQRTWLALFRHIERLTTHPALAGWLITTARNECLRVIAARRREVPVDEPIAGREPDERRIDDELLEAEQREALRRAVDGVPEHERKLMRLLLQEPPLSYDEISAALGIPKGSIGPTRGRCVARLRGDRHLASVIHGRPMPGHDLS